MQLFELLGLFERCSGLKINESKSELLWLGSWRHRKDKISNLQISEELQGGKRSAQASAQASAHPLSQAQGGLFCVRLFVCFSLRESLTKTE